MPLFSLKHLYDIFRSYHHTFPFLKLCYICHKIHSESVDYKSVFCSPPTLKGVSPVLYRNYLSVNPTTASFPSPKSMTSSMSFRTKPELPWSRQFSNRPKDYGTLWQQPC